MATAQHSMQDYVHALNSHDLETQADAVISMISQLMNAQKAYEAFCLSKRLKFPKQNQVSSAQQAKYQYYVGLIALVHMDYSEAAEALERALRATLPDPTKQQGFKLATTKLYALALMLMGKVPLPTVLRPAFVRAMSTRLNKDVIKPYADLAAAMQSGSVVQYQAAFDKYQRTWATDGVTEIVSRLNSAVQHAAVRNMAKVYSRCPLEKLRVQLGHPNIADTIGLVAACISSGEVSAEVQWDGVVPILASMEVEDPYQAGEPQSEFHRGAMQFLGLRRDMVSSMRYHPRKAIDEVDLDELVEEVEDRKAAQKEMESVAKKDDRP
ncbi:PCI domain [Carpediemonas membranifera]|uniref:PCI domain n=1 Tax=Carpediemonas membranifera TaxID=201153 RepID=A0A8J6E1K3_9EUKA|nr:PCI domain [Carpediemonas membranifera]|eukprot:KAG9393578.1 PCI domain [Carpediemonas membranifera]